LRHTYLNADPPCLEHEYVAGGDLAGLIYQQQRNQGKLPPDMARRIVYSLARVMTYPHQLQPPIVHRDLKPANILVRQKGDGKVTLHITDFGIGGVAAAQALEKAREASTGHFLATALNGTHTPLYASPQQKKGAAADPRDDVYALGIIWYQMLIGDLSEEAPTGSGWMEPFRKQGGAAAELDLLQACFDTNPACRPQDAGALAKRLKRIIEPEPPVEAGPQPTEDREPPPSVQKAVGAKDPEVQQPVRVGRFGPQPGGQVATIDTTRGQTSSVGGQGRSRVARYWCVNFDTQEVLQHGLQENFWAMQYQYSHGGHFYQGGPNQLASTAKHWKAVAKVEAGDWLVAYLKPKRFYAVGEVIEPRQRVRHDGKPVHEGCIERTVTEQTHRFLDGVVRYTPETRVFYEDFTDPWVLSVTNRYSQQREDQKYPQRIDVREWEHKCAGVQVEGLAEAVAFPLYRLSVFELPEPFFKIIRERLQAEAR
jgi:protein kinase-like protein